jgi:hypothetical protein
MVKRNRGISDFSSVPRLRNMGLTQEGVRSKNRCLPSMHRPASNDFQYQTGKDKYHGNE